MEEPRSLTKEQVSKDLAAQHKKWLAEQGPRKIFSRHVPPPCPPQNVNPELMGEAYETQTDPAGWQDFNTQVQELFAAGQRIAAFRRGEQSTTSAENFQFAAGEDLPQNAGPLMNPYADRVEIQDQYESTVERLMEQKTAIDQLNTEQENARIMAAAKEQLIKEAQEKQSVQTPAV